MYRLLCLAGFFLWVLVMLLVLEFLVLGGLYLWRRNIISQAQEKQAQIIAFDQQLNGMQEEISEALSAQLSLQSFSSLLDKHIHWTNVWDELARTTLKTAVFDSIEAASESGEFLLSGSVSDYTALGKLMLGLESSGGFQQIELISAGVATEGPGVIFEIRIIMDGSLLLETAGDSEMEGTVEGE